MPKKHPGDPTYSKSYSTRAQGLLANIKSRAKKKGLEYDLDYHWYMDKYEKGICEATGIPFEEPEYNQKKGNTSPFIPSVDRIDPDKGYTKDNCQVVVWVYNLIKSRFTHEHVVTFCRGFLIAEAARKRQE